MMRARHGMLIAAALATLMLGAGCKDAAPGDPTPVRTFKITPASGPQASPTAAPARTATVVVAAGGELEIGTRNSTLKFDKDSLSATAGAVKIVFNNADSGVPHNFHVFEGSDAKGKSVGDTDLASGPVEQALTLELTAGPYYFQCDAHPTTMKGTLTVQ